MANEPVTIPPVLIKALRIKDPNTYKLIFDLLSARETGDRRLQKQIRSKLRENGFYLSRLAQGEDPYPEGWWPEPEPEGE